MSRNELERLKRKVEGLKPDSRQAALNYQFFNEQMAEYDAEVQRLKDIEAELEKNEIFEEMETLGQIRNLERRRNNRLQTIEVLKSKYVKLGMRSNRAKGYKLRQNEIVDQIIGLEEEIDGYSIEIDRLVTKQMRRI